MEPVPIDGPPTEEEVVTAQYYKWMYSPSVLLTASFITFFTGAGSETAWLVNGIWGIATAIFIFAWFHAFVHDGPYATDPFFSNYSVVVEGSIVGSLLTTAWGMYKDSSYPVASVTNISANLIAFFINRNIKALYPPLVDEEPASVDVATAAM